MRKVVAEGSPGGAIARDRSWLAGCVQATIFAVFAVIVLQVSVVVCYEMLVHVGPTGRHAFLVKLIIAIAGIGSDRYSAGKLFHYAVSGFGATVYYTVVGWAPALVLLLLASWSRPRWRKVCVGLWIVYMAVLGGTLVSGVMDGLPRGVSVLASIQLLAFSAMGLVALFGDLLSRRRRQWAEWSAYIVVPSGVALVAVIALRLYG